MTPAECRPGMLVRLCSAPGRIWEVMAVEDGWAELLHRPNGARCQITISSLLPVEQYDKRGMPLSERETWQERVWTEAQRNGPEQPRARLPSALCWIAILVAIAFAALHVWAAIEIGRSASGLDPIGSAIAIASGGMGWTVSFVTMLWIQWHRR